MKKLLLIIAIITLTVLSARADAFEYPYVVEVKDSTDMVLTDSTFYKIARSVIFPVNGYAIPEKSEFYHELTTQILPEMNKRGYRLVSISIRGAASPEGPYENNVFLGKRRLKAIYDLIQDNMPQTLCNECTTQNDEPEDYKFLVRMMEEAGDSNAVRVKALVDELYNTDVAQLKERLHTLDQGNLWQHMLRKYFPQLRAARIVLFFKKAPLLGRVEGLVDDTLDNLQPKFMGLQPLRFTEYSPAPRRELLSVKTNLLFDFAYMPLGYKDFCPIPNVAIEYYPLHGHFTYGAMFDCPWWQGGTKNHKYFQVRNYTLETRFYFRSGDINKVGIGHGAAFKGAYLQAYVNAGLYGIGWSDKKGFDGPGSIGGHGWQGEGAGAGLGIGYVLPLGKEEHWRLEFSASAGYFRTKYDPYIYGCPVEQQNDGKYYYIWYRDADEFVERQYRFSWLGPTRVGIQLSYDLLYRKNRKDASRRRTRGASFKAWEGGVRR